MNGSVLYYVNTSFREQGAALDLRLAPLIVVSSTLYLFLIISGWSLGLCRFLQFPSLLGFDRMRRRSPSFSPPRRGYGGRGRSPPRGRYRGYGGRREPNTSLLVRNIPRDCRPDELRIPFERFGPLKDVYLPKDYYTGEPRGFGFVQFIDPLDAAEAQYHMDGQFIGGREITVVLAEENRKKPEEMRMRGRIRGPTGYGRHRSGRSRSPSLSPRYHSASSRGGHRSRSYSPATRRGPDQSVSPSPERGRDKHHRSPSISCETDRGRSPVRRSHSSQRSRDRKRASSGNGHCDPASQSSSSRRDSLSPSVPPRRRRFSTSPHSYSRSLSGSRSRSADLSPRAGRSG